MGTANTVNTMTEAVAHFAAGRREQAESAFRRLLDSEPGNGEAWNLYAVTAAQSARLDEAVARFSRAIAIAPDRAEYHANLGSALWEQRRADEAAASCREALRLNPRLAGALNTLGHALFALGQYEQAETSYRRALQLTPGDALAHNHLGIVLRARGQTEQAAACYRQALALNPDLPDACVNLGMVLKEHGHIEEARALFARAQILQPDHPHAAEQSWQVAGFWREPVVGRRIELRPYDESAAGFLQRCFLDGEFLAHYHRYLPHGENQARLAGILRAARHTLPWKSGTVDWVIHRRGESEQPIGLTNLVDLNGYHRRAEFLIGIPAEQDRNAGTGLEAALLVMEFAFNRARLNKLVSLVYEDNTRSRESILALGFSQEGYRPRHLRDPKSQEFFGIYEYGLTAADFRANQRLARLSQRLLGWDVTTG